MSTRELGPLRTFFFCLFQRQVDDCIVDDTARPFMVAGMALCLGWIWHRRAVHRS